MRQKLCNRVEKKLRYSSDVLEISLEEFVGCWNIEAEAGEAYKVTQIFDFVQRLDIKR